jgi:DNA modification methylase
MKIFRGDFFQIHKELEPMSFDLIIADIHWTLLWNYEYVFKQLKQLMKEDGFLVVTVDSYCSILALVVYLEIGSNIFDINEVAVFDDGERWSNIIVFKNKRNQLANPRLPAINHFGKGVGIHPNSKDKKLYEMIVDKFSEEGDKVLDPFMGEGNTALVCCEKKRDYMGIEIEENWYNYAKELVKDFI